MWHTDSGGKEAPAGLGCTVILCTSVDTQTWTVTVFCMTWEQGVRASARREAQGGELVKSGVLALAS